MIENFNKTKDPKFVLEHYIKKHMDKINKKYKVFQPHLPSDLLKYDRMHSSKLIIEEHHHFNYVELKIQLPPFKDNSWHLMAADTQLLDQDKSYVEVTI